MKTITFALLSPLLCTLTLGFAACEAPPPPSPAEAPVAEAASAVSACAPIDPGTPVCDQVSTTGQGGLTGPLAICSWSQPCHHSDGTPFFNAINLTKSDLSDMCTLANSTWADPKAWYYDPVVGEWRYACLYTPLVSWITPRPLLIFFPGSEADVDTMYEATGLREDAEAAGFLLAGVQAFNTHEFGCVMPDGQHSDYFYRDFTPGGCNHDVRFVDWLIDDLVASGRVDPSRIFVTGWSNGAYFAEAYAIARYSGATPGNNHVAAAAVYAGADPFGNIEDTGCGQAAQYPTSQVPIQLVHRSCDALVPCDAQYLIPDGCTTPPVTYCSTAVTDVTSWLDILATKVGDANGSNLTLDTLGLPVSPAACLDTTSCNICNPIQGALNHILWPKSWEIEMLAFLAGHPHP